MVIGFSKKLMELNENKVCYKYKLIIHDYFGRFTPIKHMKISYKKY